MRRWSLWLVALCLASSTTAFAQRADLQTNQRELNRFASAAAKDYKANRSKAIKLARKHGWVVEKTFSDGRHISLQGLDATGMPIYYITYSNSRAAATLSTDQLWAGGSLGLNLSGAGSAVTNKLGIWDGGRVRQTHQELTGRVTQKDLATSNNDHATHVAGTMMATGVNQQAKGMAHGLKNLLAYDFNSDVSEMAAAASGLLVSNHSYGTISGWRYNSDRKGTDADPYWEWWGNPDISTTEDFKFGYYDASAASWDKIAFDAPYYLMVKSSGNNRNEMGPAEGKPFYRRNKSGAFELVAARPAGISDNSSYDIISTTGTAKNILTVGAVSPIPSGYKRPSDVYISDFSSWGPTDDGRIKPDIVGNGVQLMSPTAAADNSYGTYSGTSMAAPNVSGSLILLQEHYANTMNGNVMRAATLKGLVIHTADEAGATPGPDYIYGWGLMNTASAANVITHHKRAASPEYKHLLEEMQLAQNQTHTIDVVASGAGPLKVTITWTDPEATPISSSSTTVLNNRTPRLINDLDIKVENKGTVYQPWILDPVNPTKAATTGNNTLDNVEQVFIANPVPGETYTIKVSHKGTLARGPQAFSLIASGVGGSIYCTSAPLSNQGTYIERILINNAPLSPARTAGCASYTNYTENMFAIEPGQSRTITIKPATCTTPASKVAKVFIDWNGNGSFDDAGEQVAVSGVVTDNTAITATITAPELIATGYKVRMRVVLAETTNAASVSACGTYAAGETQDYLVQLDKPAREVSAVSVAPVGQAICASQSQAVLVRIRNNGTSDLTNIPVTVTVKKKGAVHAQLTGVYSDILQAGREDGIILTAFATEPGETYELIAETGLQGDVITSNNKTTSNLTIATPDAAPQASVFRCGHDPNYTFTGTGNGTIFWYDSPTSTTPVAAGNNFQLPVSNVGNTMYASLNDLDMSVGYKTKSELSSGGYNQFTPDIFVKAHAPVILESTRLYVGWGGKVTFTVFNKNNEVVSERTLQVTATRTVPTRGEAINDPNDKGEVHYLGLELPAAGEYRIVTTYGEEATLFRNNQASVPYPVGKPNVFTITGNSADPNPETYYYYFYDLKVKALGCKSERVQVQIKGATPLELPVVSRTGHTLRSSASEGNQWYLNGKAIAGATNQELVPTESGKYSVIVEREGCFSEESVTYTYNYKQGQEPTGTDFIAYPNPSTGTFTLVGDLGMDDVLTYTLYDMLGNTLRSGSIDKFNGQYEVSLDMGKAASGMYLLRIQKNDDVTVKRLVLQR